MSAVFKRRIVREKVLQILYAYELNGVNLKALINTMFSDLDEDYDRKFGESLVNLVLNHKDELDIKIQERISNWEMNRVALIDKLLLRIAICEILFFPDIPPKVSINEAIEIAKVFSTAGSGKFINGILDAILTSEKSSGKLNKTGRGLIEETLSKSHQKNN